MSVNAATMTLLSIVLVSGESDQRNGARAAAEMHLALGSCADTNLNLFLPAEEAKASVPQDVGSPIVMPLFGGNTTPFNIAHFHCEQASIDDQPLAPINIILVRFGLNPRGHYVKWVLTDSHQLHNALRSRGIDSHFITGASLDMAGATWTTTCGGEFSPYSVAAHQRIPRPISNGEIDWVFSGSRGAVHITGHYTLFEEFADRNPMVSVPERSALRSFFEHARGSTAPTHRQSFDLRLQSR
jgi:hypothetical protein